MLKYPLWQEISQFHSFWCPLPCLKQGTTKSVKIDPSKFHYQELGTVKPRVPCFGSQYLPTLSQLQSSEPGLLKAGEGHRSYHVSRKALCSLQQVNLYRGRSNPNEFTCIG